MTFQGVFDAARAVAFYVLILVVVIIVSRLCQWAFGEVTLPKSLVICGLMVGGFVVGRASK